MKRSLAALIALAMPAAAQAAEPIVPFDQGRARPAAEVSGPGYRIQVLTPSLIRLERAEDGRFEDRPTMTAIDRRMRVPPFDATRRDGTLTIETAALTLRYDLGTAAFGRDSLELTRQVGGERRTVNPDPAGSSDALGGWRRSLDLVDGEVPLHPGLLSRAGWQILDDSATALLVPGEPGFTVRAGREGGYQDLYLFAYGQNYARGLRDLRALTGPTPLLERKTFGVWFSRYWPYSGEEFRAIAERFHRERIPLDTISLDTDFKAVRDPIGSALGAIVAGQEGEPFSWNGWEWNTDLYPDPPGFVDWAHSEGIGLALNVHPSINNLDPRFPEAQDQAGGALRPDDGCRVIQADTQGLCHVFDWTDPDQLAAYFDLHRPFEQQGIDAWWLDWCCDPSHADAPGLTPDTLINWRYAERSRARGSRWPAFQRIGGSLQAGFGGAVGLGAFAEHRQTLQFTGDTCGSWELLRFVSEFTAAEGSIGMPYVSHDIGSFHSVSPLGLCDGGLSPPLTPRLNSVPPDMYARWIQLGTFQPLLRLHSSHGERLPWEYRGKAGTVAADFLRLREALIPYIYTAAREAHDTGLPIARALWLIWPDREEAYEERFAHEYMLGDDILVSPVVEPGDPGSATVWLPPGKWIDFWDGRRLTGPRVITTEVPLERMPVYVKAGAIVPTQPYAKTTPEGSAKELILTAYHGARAGRTTIYDDAGDGLAYLEGDSGRIAVEQRRVGRRLGIVIAAERGRFSGMPRRRSYELQITGVRRAPIEVGVEGRRLPGSAWDYAPDLRAMSVELGPRPTKARTRVSILLSEHG